MEAWAEVTPELRDALAYALRYIVDNRPSSPVRVCAAKLLEFSSRSEDASGASAEAPVVDTGDADDEQMKLRTMARGRGRRQVVFSEPVKLDGTWTPVVIPKSEEDRDEIAAVLQRNILFAAMDDDQRRILIDAMVRKEFPADTAIITQGDPGDFYYILTEGTAEILVNGKKVLQAVKGMGFGELALLYDSPRAATVVASSAVQTWAIDRVSFKRVMIGTTIRKRELYEGFLKAVPIFATLTPDEILTIADTLQPVVFKAGEAVVSQGDAHADRFYIVEDGELKAEIRGVPGEVCERLRCGSYFGERALIKDEPRAATVTAVALSKCLAMDRAAFLRLLGPITELLHRNLEVYSRYASGTTPRVSSPPPGRTFGTTA